MKSLLRIATILLLAAPSALGSGFITIGNEASIPWPDDWYLGSDSLNFPFQLIYHNDSAEIVVYKSQISESEEIRNHLELKDAVDLVASDVIGALHESQLYTSTGYFDTSRASFVLEFKSSDSLSGLPVRHRLAGILYRQPDDGQLLFTIWGKAAEQVYDEVSPAMEFVQSGFAYQGDCADTVFPPSRRNWWMATLIALGVAGMLLVILRWRHRRPAGPTVKAHFWTCQCGRANHDSSTSCRRCGRPRPTSPTAI